MDWGVMLTGVVFIVMLALMLVISSLDRKIMQHQEQRILIAEPEVEGAGANASI